MSTPKIAFINQPFGTISAARQRGSISIWIYEMAKQLAPSFNVSVFARLGSGERGHEVKEGIHYHRFAISLEKLVVKLQEKWTHRKRPFFASPYYYRRYITQIAREIRRQEIDVVHITNFFQFVPIVRAFNPKAKIVLHMQCEWLSQLDHKWIQQGIAEADLITGCSNDIVAKICARFPEIKERTATVWNGVDPDSFQFSQTQKPQKRILFVSRLSPEKGVHLLIDAFKQVTAVYPHVDLDIVGPQHASPYMFTVGISHEPSIQALSRFYKDGYRDSLYQEHLQAMIPSHLRDKLHFWGEIPHQQLQERFAAATLFVQPSLYEPFGMCLVEAMASGVPVIAAKVGGMVEILNNGNAGRLVDPDNAENLANALLTLLEDRNQRETFVQIGHERVQRFFTWDACARTLAQHLQKLYKIPNANPPETSVSIQ
ncbi:MAG: glycosyltransferase family 4 protein [Chloroflexota bacterium]